MMMKGYLARDLEVKPTKHGTVGRTSIAVNIKDKTAKETTTWFNIEIHDKDMMEQARPLALKGKYVHVQGRLRQDTWGENNEKVSIVVEADQVRIGP